MTGAARTTAIAAGGLVLLVVAVVVSVLVGAESVPFAQAVSAVRGGSSDAAGIIGARIDRTLIAVVVAGAFSMLGAIGYLPALREQRRASG